MSIDRRRFVHEFGKFAAGAGLAFAGGGVLGGVLRSCGLDTEQSARIAVKTMEAARNVTAAVEPTQIPPPTEVAGIAVTHEATEDPYWTINNLSINGDNYPVVQVPDGKPNTYVDEQLVTQLTNPTRANIELAWLAAHNRTLVGRKFFELKVDDIFFLSDTEDRLSMFSVAQLVSYETEAPLDPYSNQYPVDSETLERLVRPEGSLPYLTSRETYNQTLKSDDPNDNVRTAVLQTCIAKNGDLSWGRRMVIAHQTFS